MNLRKAKKLRKALNYHPAMERQYEVMGIKGPTVINKGTRNLYRLAKRSAKRAGVA